MSDSQYLSKAIEAYNKEDYIYCNVLLKRVDVYDVNTYTILVDCSFAIWKNGIDHDSIPDNMINVKDAYSRMFDAIDPREIFAYHYVRLSHLYIVEGAMEGAMSIIQLASSRGHLVSPLIVMQRWALLKRYGTKKEAAECLNYMSTAVSIEDDEVGKDGHLYPAGSHGVLKMSTMLMFCSSHMQQVTSQLQKTIDVAKTKSYTKVSPKKNIKARDHAGELFLSLIREAYIQITGKEPSSSHHVMEWYCSSKQWLALGKELESADSFYTLLAEEAYWEAYVRGALSGEGIEKCIDLMVRTKRAKEDIYETIERAHEYHHWNIYCRHQLINDTLFPDLVDDVKNQYKERFAVHEAHATTIQRYTRGHLLRLHWLELSEFAKEVKDRHLASLLIADEWAARNHIIKMIALVKLWRENAVELKELKLNSVIMLQYNVRGYFGRLLYRRKFAGVKLANKKYIQMCQLTYDMTRLRLFKIWRKIHIHTRLVRCASVIESVLFANGFAQVVSSATETMLSAIRIRRKYTRVRTMHLWQKLFKRRQRLHARATIRFFIRNICVKIRERAKEAYYKEIERKVGILIVQYSLPRKKKTLLHWRGVFRRFLKKRMKLKVARWGRRCFHRYKLKKRVPYNRMIYELYLSVYKLRCYRRISLRHSMWKNEVFARHLQRFFRIVLARWAVQRRRKVLEEVEEGHLFQLYKLKIYRLWRWKKLVFLRKRHRHRCARRIAKLFRFIRTKAILRRHATRKKFSKDVVTFLCHRFMRKKLFQLSNGARDEKRMTTLGPAFMSLWTRSLRNAFHKWHNNICNQLMLDGAIEVMMRRRVDPGFWEHSGLSVRIMCGSFDIPDRNSKSSAEGLFRWEQRVVPTVALLDTSKYALIKMFKIWMAAFRLQNKVKRNLSLFTAEYEVLHHILPELKLRIDCRVIMQSCFRFYAARKRLTAAKHWHYSKGEATRRIRQGHLWKNFMFLVTKKRARVVAREQLQQCWRMALARRHVNRQRRYRSQLSNCYNIVSRSAFQLKFMRNVCRRMQLAYCAKIFKKEEPHALTSLVSTVNITKAAPAPMYGNLKLKSNKKILTPLQLKNSLVGGRTSVQDLPWDGGNIEQIFIPVPKTKKGKVNMEFQSSAFNIHLFRLKQNGIFIWDVRNKELLLTENETIFCMKNCQTLFCPYIFVAPMKVVAEHFVGRKLVLCGGSVRLSACWQYLDDMLQKRGEGVDVNVNTLLPLPPMDVQGGSNSLTSHWTDGISAASPQMPPLCFHCSDMTFQDSCMYMKDVDMFCRKHILPHSFGLKLHSPCMSSLMELSVDTHSFGLLGVAKLLLALQHNTTVTNLIVKCSNPKDYIACYGDCIYKLGQTNKTLKEFRFYGAPFPPYLLKGLYCVLANITYVNGEILPNRCEFVGFQTLTMLEFSADEESNMLVQLIVRIAKQRLSIPGCEGLSVTVN